jgi:hypothetical protein
LTIVAVLAIPARAIDHERARGLAVEDTGALRQPESWRVLFRSRPLVVFAAAAAIFHFANGPLLQLVAQKLALAHPGYETGLTSAAIIITQLTTIPMALLVTRANALGRKPLLTIAFAAVPLRGLLCASFDNPSWLLGVQLLDGVGAGMYDALLPLLLADMMRGTGRYSLARGVLGTIQGIGGSIGLGAAGFIVAAFGYNMAFLTLAAVAVIALLVIVVAMPETRPTPGKPHQPPLGGVDLKRDSHPDAGATHINKPTSVCSPETDSRRRSLLLRCHVAAGLAGLRWSRRCRRRRSVRSSASGHLNPSLTAGREPSPTNLTQWVAMASLSLREAAEQTGATPETVGANDIAVAFAALQVELTGLLGRVAEVRANDELREDNHENRRPEQLDVIADKGDHLRKEAAPSMKSANAAIDKTETPIPTPTNEEAVETPRKRSWWRRLVR